MKPNKIIPEDALKTFDFGSLEGKKQTKEVNDHIHNNIINNPDEKMHEEGESFTQATNRVVPKMKDILKTAPANTTIVTHNSIYGLIKLWDKENRPENFDRDQREAYTKQDNKFETGSHFTIQGENGPIHVVRHGQTKDNKEHLMRTSSTPLTNEGIKEAKTVGKTLSKHDIPEIITSPLDRAIHTSKLILGEQQKKSLRSGGWLDNYGKDENANEGVSKGPSDMETTGVTNKGFDYNGAWGGQFQHGGETQRVSNTMQEGLNAFQMMAKIGGKSALKHLPFSIGSAVGLVDSAANKEDANLSDALGLIPNVPAQAASLMSLYAEKENENLQKATAQRNRGKTSNQLIKPRETNLRVAETTSVRENGGWLDSFANGGSMPGSVGFTYARTKGIPSNGPGGKKTVPSAQSGKVIDDNMGQWAHPGEITRINSNNITMQGVPYDVLGISDTGDIQHMKPGKNYKFKGNKVTELPVRKGGGNLRQEQKGKVNLDNLLNFTNYNTPQPGGWLDNL